MQLSLTQARTWKGLLLLVSCMILWISVTPTPYDQMSNEELYDNLLSCSHRTHVVARKMYKILDLNVAERRCFKNKRNNTCHTTSTHTAKTIQPGIEENDYPVWSSLKELRSSNKSIHLFAFCKFFYCLRKDTKKIKDYLQILRPNIIKNKW
ncbi:prolactin-like protein 1, isoform CRA_b [Rattus norvegicus]|uniref:Prolactin-like protein 1, isoform CRA_b n=1 Tax=Rattus norvegicus TaxID=10116 RepID=A6J7T1_RAT|nr:prolactin-like protein 1, isoform CRA_b [Rattus norvegicus]